MSEHPLIGTVLADRYRIDTLIGEGAMGRVFRAEHVLMRKRVAVKVLHKELTAVPEIVQRFEREAMAAAHIDHPHVASATDFGKLDDGHVYLVLEYVEGASLSALIEQGPVPLGRALGIAAQIGSALEAAHERDIVHRDLKPDNIHLIQREDSTDFVKVLDFGIAKVPAEPSAEGKPITQVGMVYGTPEYMAPEQALGQEVDQRADVYALGVILYEMLSGVRPYDGPVVGLLGQQLSKPLPSMIDRSPGVMVPPQVEAFVRSLLKPNANDRLSSATEVVDGLTQLADELAQAPLHPARGNLLSAQLDELTGKFQRATEGDSTSRSDASGGRTSRSRGFLLALAAGLIGVGTAIFVVGALTGSPEETLAEASDAVEASDEELISPELDLEQDLQAARQQGAGALRFLADKHPGEARVFAVLAHGLATEGKYAEAVEAARTALELDPNIYEDKALKGALFRAAQSRSASGKAFRLLEGAMGSVGADIIYDLHTRAGTKAEVRGKTSTYLKSEEGRAAADPALLLLLDLEAARACSDVASLVKKAALHGDRRALPHLKKMVRTTGCGSTGHQDCYPCLRGDDTLSLAISTLEKRATLEAEAPPAPATK